MGLNPHGNIFKALTKKTTSKYVYICTYREKTMEGNTKIKIYLCIFEIFHRLHKNILKTRIIPGAGIIDNFNYNILSCIVQNSIMSKHLLLYSQKLAI